MYASIRKRVLALLVFALAVIILPLAFSWPAAEPASPQDQEEKPVPKYIGAKKCKVCHSSAKLSDIAFKTWQKALHSQSFKNLSLDTAKEVATEMGVGDPQKSDVCLKCHFTLGKLPKPPGEGGPTKILPPLVEGISCEHCHGPASLWNKPHALKIAERPSKEELIKMGLRDLVNFTKEQKNALCVECHKEDPANKKFYKEFNYDEFWEKIKHGKKAEKKDDK